MSPYGLARQISTFLRTPETGLTTEVRRDAFIKGDAQIIVYAPYTERKRGDPKVYPVAAIDIGLDLEVEVRGADDAEVAAVRSLLKEFTP